MASNTIESRIPDNMAELSIFVRNNELYATESLAQNPEDKDSFQYFIDLYHKGIEKLKGLGINYRDKFSNPNEPK
ncbi:MAG: hypothetical protein AABW63_01910 [Nanoarchaeota archaeon]